MVGGGGGNNQTTKQHWIYNHTQWLDSRVTHVVTQPQSTPDFATIQKSSTTLPGWGSEACAIPYDSKGSIISGLLLPLMPMPLECGYEAWHLGIVPGYSCIMHMYVVLWDCHWHISLQLT